LENLFVIGVFVAVFLLLWMNGLALVALRKDDTLNKFQKVAQGIFVCVVPYFGAVIVLHLVLQHLPTAIPKAFLLWPFKRLVVNKLKQLKRNNDNNPASHGDIY
jgi:hypothetical protein